MIFSRIRSVLSGIPDQFEKALKFIGMGVGCWPSRGEWLHYDGTREGVVQKTIEFTNDRDAKHYRLKVNPIDNFAVDIGHVVKDYIFPVVKCRVCFETERRICNDSIQLIMSVLQNKTDDIPITDADRNALVWERFETDFFPVLNLTRPSFDEKPCRILDSICTPHDVWGYTYWGEDIQPGDVLMIRNSGCLDYNL